MTMPPDVPQNVPPSLPPHEVDYQGSQMTTKDAEHLNILSVCWWVVAGMQALGFCIGLVYVVLAFVAGASVFRFQTNQEQQIFTVVFGSLGGCFMILACVVAFLSYLVGKSLRQRRRITLCYVMAALMCLSIPLGTVLGIFTFIVLGRPSVKASFH